MNREIKFKPEINILIAKKKIIKIYLFLKVDENPYWY